MGAVRESRAVRTRPAIIAACMAAVFAIAIGAAIASPQVGDYELQGLFGPDGTAGTGFSNPRSVAIDQGAGVLYVADSGNGTLYKFDLDGQPVAFSGSGPSISGNKITGLSIPGIEGEGQVAVDQGSHKIYVTSANAITAFQASGEPALFSAGSGVGTNKIGGFTGLTGVAVDPNGAIYGADGTAGLVKIYASAGESVTQFSSAAAAHLAVNSVGAVYVNRKLNPRRIFKYTPNIFPVTAATTYSVAAQPLTEKNSFSLTIDRSTNYVYITQAPGGATAEPNVTVFDQSGAFVKHFAGAGEENAVTRPAAIAVEEIPGKLPKVFIAENPSSGLRQVKILKPFEPFEGPPSVISTSVADVTADSATFLARINPNVGETTYRFEYGPADCASNPCASVPLGGAGIGSGYEPVPVSQEVAGLQSESTYYYRVVADNTVEGDPKFGITEGPTGTFTTQGAGLDFLLPDRRAWEMVSPPDKRGARIGSAVESGQVQAAVDGDRLAYLTGGNSIVEYPDGSRAPEALQALAERDEAGWRSQDLTNPNAELEPLAVGAQSEYKLFSPDLSEALFEPRTDTLLSPEASGRTPYWRRNTQPPLYRPLLTDKEEFANVPPGTSTEAAVIRAATPDLSKVVLRSAVPLVPGAPTPGLYRWSDGEIEPVSVLPAAEGGALVPAERVGSGNISVRHAISDDGARVFWTSLSPPRLYMREMESEETVRIDLPAGGSEAGAVNPIFQGASADGRVVFFTDTQQLTAGASPSGADLYRCEIPLDSPVTGCTSLTDLSAPLAGSGESAEIVGMVPALSDDGSRIYFVAKGVLDEAQNQAGGEAEAGKPNLYRWEEGEDVRFVATLSDQDDADWGMPGTVLAPGQAAGLSAATSPDGRYFVFMSEESLTGEENLQASSGWEPVERVFQYDAVDDTLQCVSCDPTGAAPEGQILPPATETSQVTSLVDPRSQWPERLVGAVLPEPTILAVEGTSVYRPRAVHDNGRVFFNSIDSLVAGDSNDQWDVYQYEPLGTGSCEPSSGDAATSRSGAGCVSLVSSGTGKEPAAFFDASVGGDDAFFLTPARLAVTDQDDQADIYDARVDGVTASLVPRAECLGEACRPSPAAPGESAPASATFAGAGNLKTTPPKRCPKGKHKVRRNGHVRCVPQKKKKKGHGHRRPGQSGRAAR